MKRFYFYHGKIIKDGFWCSFCDMMRTGRLIRDLYMWRVHMSCGHVRSNVGFTMPQEELERKGFINQKFKPDPRYLARVKQEWLGFFAKRKEMKDRETAADLFSSHSILH